MSVTKMSEEFLNFVESASGKTPKDVKRRLNKFCNQYKGNELFVDTTNCI